MDKKPFQFEHRVELSDRAIAYILQLGEVECDTGGAPTRIHGAAQDITDRKKAEERLKTTLDSMPQGCQLIDFHYRYLYVNDAVAKQGKTTKEELVGATMMEKYPGIENTHIFELSPLDWKKIFLHTGWRVENERKLMMYPSFLPKNF